MTSQTAQQIIAIHILPNISRSKGCRTMKFVQLIEYNIANIFLEKSPTNCDGEPSTRTFYKKQKLSISQDQQSEMLLSFQVEFYQEISKLSFLTICFYLK